MLVELPFIALFTWLVTQALAQEWSRFRGPMGAGVATVAGAPAEVNSERTLLWRVPVPPGKSSPVLSGNQLFLTGWRGDERRLLAVDSRSGEVLRERSMQRRHLQWANRLNDPAAPTPAVDGDHVHAFFADYGLISFDLNGNPRWHVPLGPFAAVHGIGTSPVAANGLVVLAIEQQTSGSSLTAWEGASGSLRWKPHP